MQGARPMAAPTSRTTQPSAPMTSSRTRSGLRSRSGLTKVFGLDFDDVTGDLLAVNNKQSLYRASMTTRTLLTGWNGISLTSFGLLDTRAVEVIGEQVLVTDGADSNLRPHTDPMSRGLRARRQRARRAGADGELRDADRRLGAARRQLHRHQYRRADELGLGLRGRRHVDRAIAVAHLHQHRDVHRQADGNQRAGSTSTTRAITVTQPTAPTASFTATPTAGSVPLAVNFTDTSTGGPTSWAWDLGTAARRPRNRRRTPTPAPGRSPPD